MPNPVINKRVVLGRSVSYDAEALSFFNRLPNPISSIIKGYINTYFVAIKSHNSLASLADGIDFMHFSGGLGTEANGKINAINSSFYLVPQSSPTWANTGYTGDGIASYLKTQYTPSTNATVFSQNDAFFAIYIRTNNQGGRDGGCQDPLNRLDIISRFIDDNHYGGVNGGLAFVATADSRGLNVSERIAGNINLWQNGSIVNTSADPSTGLCAQDIYLLGYNNTGVLLGPSTKEQCFDVIGKATKIDQAHFYTITQTLMTQLGIQI